MDVESKMILQIREERGCSTWEARKVARKQILLAIVKEAEKLEDIKEVLIYLIKKVI